MSIIFLNLSAMSLSGHILQAKRGIWTSKEKSDMHLVVGEGTFFTLHYYTNKGKIRKPNALFIP